MLASGPQNAVLHDAGAQIRLAYDRRDALELSGKIIPDVSDRTSLKLRCGKVRSSAWS